MSLYDNRIRYKIILKLNFVHNNVNKLAVIIIERRVDFFDRIYASDIKEEIFK